MRPGRLLRWTAPILFALAGASCADLGNRPAAKVGNDVITLEDLRRESAELPPANRPSLGTRAERIAFVEEVIRRRLLVDHARTQVDRAGAALASVASADSLADRTAAHEREDILLRRLQALEGGMGDPSEAELQESMERSATRFRFRRVLFASMEAAKQASAEWAAGAELEPKGRNALYQVLPAEERDGFSWPIDPVMDAISILKPGEVSPPLWIDGQAQTVQLLARNRRDTRKDETVSTVAEGARRRKRALAFEALENRLLQGARPTFDAPAMSLLASRIRDAVLDGTPENDLEFAIPEISPEEGTRVIASWSARKGATSQITIQEVVDALRRMSPARRPMRGALVGQVQRIAEAEVKRRLLLEEASRRGIEQDWWADRQLRRIEEERLLRLATRRIEDEASFSESKIDSLTTMILAARPKLLREPVRARVVRIDNATREAALEERAFILAAGGAIPRYTQILNGNAVSPASYHFLSLTPSGVSSLGFERAIFEAPAGGVHGPFLFGQIWILFETIGIEPERERTPEEVRAEVSRNFREGQGASIVEAWVQARRNEVGVTIHEDVIDHLAPGA
jgi:hypothetical protein